MRLTRMLYEGERVPDDPFRFSLIVTIVQSLRGDPGIWYAVPVKWLPPGASAIVRRGEDIYVIPEEGTIFFSR